MYRPEIDGLRALAVICVVLFHAFPSRLTGGYVGVDVFFVISGYLITKIVLNDLQSSAFSFADFYKRRINRIFPALCLVLLFTAIAGLFLLHPDKYQSLARHISASAVFSSNLLLWSESDYFDDASDVKPLLHLWSLGIEEQFYLLWPLLLWLVYRLERLRFFILVFAALLSFCLNIWLTPLDSVFSFYLIPTRAWELMAGGIATLILHHPLPTRVTQKLSLPWMYSRFWIQLQPALGILLIFLGAYSLDKSTNFPGYWALLPTAGAFLLITSKASSWVISEVLSRPILVAIGLISYPLYLWHWPLLVFARLQYGELPSASTRIVIVLTSVVFAYLTYKFVESPFRRNNKSSKHSLILLVGMSTIGLSGVALFTSPKLFDFASDRAYDPKNTLSWIERTSTTCSKRYGLSPCLHFGGEPKILVVGDSHANHLIPGIAEQVTKGGVLWVGTCPPILGFSISPTFKQNQHPCTNQDASTFNLQLLDQHPSIDTVILSSYWRLILDGHYINTREALYWGELKITPVSDTATAATRFDMVYLGLHEMISQLLHRNKRTVLVRDNPEIERHIIDECMDNQTRRFIHDCSRPRDLLDTRRASETRLIHKLQSDFPSLIIVDPYDTLCTTEKCQFVQASLPRYRDEHHLSLHGSSLVGRHIFEKLSFKPD